MNICMPNLGTLLITDDSGLKLEYDLRAFDPNIQLLVFLLYAIYRGLPGD